MEISRNQELIQHTWMRIEMQMEQGKRFNLGKPKWSLVPQSALIPAVRSFEYGANKYGPHNWKKGLPMSEICESLKRHLDAYMEGEEIDKESGLPHIGFIQTNAIMLSWMNDNKPQFNDLIVRDDNSSSNEESE